MQPNEPKFKLPDYTSTQKQTYTPRFTATLQSGLFRQPAQPTQPQEEQGLFPAVQQPEAIQTETEKRISDLQRQVDNLTKRLTESEGEKADTRNWFEKMVNLPEGQVWWQDAFDLIDRPVRAIKEGLTDKSWEAAWEGFAGNRPGPFEEGYIEGSQFLVNMGVIKQSTLDEASPGYKLFLDIGVDIFADPLTYFSPTKLLQKIGILPSKTINLLDEAIKGARAGGLVDITEKAIKKAIKNGTDEVVKILTQAGKSSDEIAEILGKGIGALADATDDVSRKAYEAYEAALESAGVMNQQQFIRHMDNFGQGFDDAGKIIFKGKAKSIKEMIEQTKQVRKFLTTQGKTVNAAYKNADTILKRLQRLEDAGGVLSDAQRAAKEALTNYRARIDFLQNEVIKFDNLANQKILDAGGQLTEAQKKQFKLTDIKPGQVEEMTVAELTRNLMEERVRKGLGIDNVYVLAADARGGGTDLGIYIKSEDGFYMQMKNRKGTPFVFEIKDPKRFAVNNLNTTPVNDETIKALRQEARKQLELHGRGSEQYKKAFDKYLLETKIYRAAGQAPTFRLVDGTRILEKYNGNVSMLEEVNEAIRKLFAARDANPGNWSMKRYAELLKKFDTEYKKAARDAVKRLGVNSWDEIDSATRNAIKDDIKAAIFTGDDAIYAPTLTTKGRLGDDVAKEILEATEKLNPKGAYAFTVKNADGVDELIILNGQDFFDNVKFQEVSFGTSFKKNKAGPAMQNTIHTYFEVDFEKLGRNPELFETMKNNSWFMDALQGAPRLRTETVYKPGLIINMLNGIKKTNIPFVAPAAELIAKTVDGLTFLFNAKAGFTDELAEFLSKVPAEDFQAAKLSVAKVKELVDDIAKRSKGRYDKKFINQVIQDLVEQGWDGVSLAGRKMNVEQLLKRWVRQYSASGYAQFVSMTDTQFRNFSEVIADVLRKEGLDPDFIKLTRKQNFTLVEFAEGTTTKEIDEVVKNLGAITRQRTINVGQFSLSGRELSFAKEFNESIQAIIAEGVEYRALLQRLGFDFADDMLGTGSYFRHSVNPKFLGYLKRNSKAATIRRFLDSGTDLLKDRLYVGSTREINAALREMFGINIDLFSTDITYNFADLVRVANTKNEMSTVLSTILKEQDTLGRNLFEVLSEREIAERGLQTQFNILNGTFKLEFPNLFKNISPQTQAMLTKYFAGKGLGEASSKIVIQKAAYGVLKKLDNAYVQLPEFIKGFDQYMKFWKTFALITPGYHMRNLVGNITNSFMVGMPLAQQGRYMFQSGIDFTNHSKIMRALQRGEDISRFSQSAIDSFKRVDDYFRSGASQSHRGIRDLEVIKEGIRQMRGQKRNLPQRIGDWLLNANYSAAESMDDLQRYSLYRWAYDSAERSKIVRAAKKKGIYTVNQIDALKRTEAYKKVSEALFDYSHLTAFEKEYMKRLFPFYTFFKNNLILQAKTIFSRPQQYGKLFRAYRYYTESMTGMDIEDLPNYMTDNLWIPFPHTIKATDTKAIAWLRANLPPSDFTEFVENPFARGVTSLTTPIKFFIEMGTGRDLFTGRQIREFPGQKNEYAGPGILQSMRDSRGRFSGSTDPLIAKFLNDVGFRSIFNYATTAIELIDYGMGNLTTEDMAARVFDALGITRVQELSDLKVASLYQNLDHLRDLKDLYEQENDGKLPSLKELEDMLAASSPPENNWANLFN